MVVAGPLVEDGPVTCPPWRGWSTSVGVVGWRSVAVVLTEAALMEWGTLNVLLVVAAAVGAAYCSVAACRCPACPAWPC